LFVLLLVIAGIQAKKCSNPSVRREWGTLSRDERADWISAVKCLTTFPHDDALTPLLNTDVSFIPPVNTSSSFYDDIVYMHMDLNFVIHFTGLFLPWHRAYVLGLEKQMKEKCHYRGAQPYWDWTQDAPDFYHAHIFDSDLKSGFGGWGDPANDFQINTGGFSQDFLLAYPVPHNIRRNYTLQPFLTLPPSPPGAPVVNDNLEINTTFTKANTDYLINSFVGDFVSFQGYLEGIQGPHGGPHLILGGDMSGTCPSNALPPACIIGAKWTPDDPLFFMHHAMVDKVWYDWQNKDPKNYWAYHGGSVPAFFNVTLYPEYPNGAPPFLYLNSTVPGDGLLWQDKTIFDFMDTLSEDLCYIYE